MSVEALVWAFNQPIPTSERFVLVALGDHADQDASCWPSRTRISARTGLSEATVKRALRSLQERGLIRVESRVRENGSSTSNRYYLQITDSVNGGVTMTPGGGHQYPGEGVPMTPPIEPSLEPSSKDPHAEAFGAWWEIYPRKVSKQAAAKAWKARTKAKDLPDDLVEITQRFAASVAGKDPEFIPHPATWLNQKRWEDVPTSAPSGQDEGPSEAYRAWLETPQGKAHLARKEAQ